MLALPRSPFKYSIVRQPMHCPHSLAINVTRKYAVHIFQHSRDRNIDGVCRIQVHVEVDSHLVVRYRNLAV